MVTAGNAKESMKLERAPVGMYKEHMDIEDTTMRL